MRSLSGGLWSARDAKAVSRSALRLIGDCISLVNQAADGAGDEDVTPSGIARSIEAAMSCPEVTARSEVRRTLEEALDAVADGMPADHVGRLLYAALERLRRS